MAPRRPVRQHGTARDLAEHAVGYSANGESQHSRNVAQASVRLGEGKRTDGRLLRETAKELAKLEHRLECETDPARRAKHAKNIAIKKIFLSRIEQQFSGAASVGHEPLVRERITVLYGENDIVPWDKVP
jgi:hypothetical protein